MPSHTLAHFMGDIKEFLFNTKNLNPPENLQEPSSEDSSSTTGYFYELGKVYNSKIEFWLAKMRKFTYVYTLLAVLHFCKIIFFDSIDTERTKWSDLIEVDRAQTFVLSNYPLVGSILDLVFAKLLIVLMSFTLCYQYYSKSNTDNMKRLNVIYY